MSLLNQVILGLLLMVTLILVGLMVRVYSHTGSIGREGKNQEVSDESQGEEMTQNE